jgi:hypothetical protein
MGRDSGKGNAQPHSPERVHKRVLARKAQLHRIQRYHVRANFLGALNWVCPCCGHINRSRLMQRRFLVECVDCHAKYVPAIVLMLTPPGGRRSIPPDYIIPDEKGSTALQEAMPLGDMQRWKQGMCVHDVRALNINVSDAATSDAGKENADEADEE